MSAVQSDVGTRRKVRRFERMLDRSADSLVQRFGESEYALMRQEMMDEYQSLVPQVPYIGGRRNRWNSNMTAAPWMLAVYRVVVRHGGDAQDAGKVAYDYARRVAAPARRLPQPLVARIMGPRRAKAEKQARWTQQRRYADDWVCEVVDGTGQPFDFGVDVTECAIVKYMHAHGADELTPYLCHLDYVLAEAAGAGLTRTKTLAWGCDRCDFRWNVPGQTTSTWPPEFAERGCGRRTSEEAP